MLCNLDEDDEEGTSLDEEDTLDNCEQTNQSFSQRKEDEEVCVEDKSPEPDGPSKSKKGEGTNYGCRKRRTTWRNGIFYAIKINSRMNESDKRQQSKGKVEKKKDLRKKELRKKQWL